MLHMSETLGINDACSSCGGVGGGREGGKRKNKIRKELNSFLVKCFAANKRSSYLFGDPAKVKTLSAALELLCTSEIN